MTDLELLRRFATQGLPVRLAQMDEFKGAQALAAAGLIKLTLPAVKAGRGTIGHQQAPLVVAITPAGKRALAG